MGSMYACKCTCVRTYQIEYGTMYKKWKREREGHGNFEEKQEGRVEQQQALVQLE